MSDGSVDEASASYYALHVALQTLKERCQSLQTRLNIVEEENDVLRRNQTDNGAGTSKNLVRSKTFTQHSPHPKINKTESSNETEHMSLEEISLQIVNKLEEGKEHFEQKCEGILDDTTGDNLCLNGVGDLETLDNFDKCTENAKLIRDALLIHQRNLKCLLDVRNKQKVTKCLECEKRHNHKSTANMVSMDSQTELTADNMPAMVANIDFVAEKRLADSLDKICPMCGEVYSELVKFESFQDHVESHFVDDSTIDLSIENLISHTVGNF